VSLPSENPKLSKQKAEIKPLRLRKRGAVDDYQPDTPFLDDLDSGSASAGAPLIEQQQKQATRVHNNTGSRGSTDISSSKPHSQGINTAHNNTDSSGHTDALSNTKSNVDGNNESLGKQSTLSDLTVAHDEQRAKRRTNTGSDLAKSLTDSVEDAQTAMRKHLAAQFETDELKSVIDNRTMVITRKRELEELDHKILYAEKRNKLEQLNQVGQRSQTLHENSQSELDTMRDIRPGIITQMRTRDVEWYNSMSVQTAPLTNRHSSEPHYLQSTHSPVAFGLRTGIPQDRNRTSYSSSPDYQPNHPHDRGNIVYNPSPGYQPNHPHDRDNTTYNPSPGYQPNHPHDRGNIAYNPSPGYQPNHPQDRDNTTYNPSPGYKPNHLQDDHRTYRESSAHEQTDQHGRNRSYRASPVYDQTNLQDRNRTYTPRFQPKPRDCERQDHRSYTSHHNPHRMFTSSHDSHQYNNDHRHRTYPLNGNERPSHDHGNRDSSLHRQSYQYSSQENDQYRDDHHQRYAASSRQQMYRIETSFPHQEDNSKRNFTGSFPAHSRTSSPYHHSNGYSYPSKY